MRPKPRIVCRSLIANGSSIVLLSQNGCGPIRHQFQSTFGHATGRYKPGNSKARKHYPGASSANKTWNDRLKYRRQSRIFSALLSKLRYAYRLYPGSALACSQDQQLRLYPRGKKLHLQGRCPSCRPFFQVEAWSTVF
jgi:hypothetical protein